MMSSYRSRFLRVLKSANITHHRANWPYYLRLLDAHLAKPRMRPGQIAEQLHTEPGRDGLDAKTVWDQLQAAQNMTQPNGYLSLFLSLSPNWITRQPE